MRLDVAFKVGTDARQEDQVPVRDNTAEERGLLRLLTIAIINLNGYVLNSGSPNG